MLRFISALFGSALLLALAPAYGQDFQKGLDAYNGGDFATALKEWRLLAEAGNANAQYNLGVMYANGKGVVRDTVQAQMWFYVAAVKGNTDKVKHTKVIAGKMTPAQIAEAQRLAREWLEAHQPE